MMNMTPAWSTPGGVISGTGKTGMVAPSATTAGATTNSGKTAASSTQNGLVNVNLQNLNLQAPVSIAVPVDIAANVCNVAVASLGTAGKCDAQSNSDALSKAIATSMLQNAANGGNNSGGGNNTQNGLVNVNLSNLNLQVPVSVAVPVAVAANVCNISVLSAGQLGSCNAKSASTALTDAIAKALASQK